MKSKQKDDLISIIIDSLQNFYKMILDEKISFELKESVLWVLLKICKYHTEIFIEKRQYLEDLINIILIIINYSNEKIISVSLEIIRTLYKNLKPEEGQNSNNLSLFTKNLIQILYTFANDINKHQNYLNSDELEYNLINQTFVTLAAIIENSPKDNKLILIELFKKIFEDFKNTLFHYINTQNKSEDNLVNQIMKNKKLKDLFQNCYCLCFSSTLVSGLLPIDFELGKQISEIIFFAFKEREEVFEEGIYVISELSLALEEQFEIIFREGFGIYLINATRSADINLKCVSLVAISDIIRSLKDLFDPYVKEIIPLIIETLKVNY